MILRQRNFCIGIYALFAGMLVLNSCSLGGPLREEVKATHFKAGRTPRGWISQKPKTDKDAEGADVVYKDRATQSLIALNSTCFRYESTSLDRLAHQYESGLKDAETVSETELIVDGRRAVRVHLKGDFDGVRSEILVTVLRKNDCLFDFSMVGKSPLTADVQRDFDLWVQGFRYSLTAEKKADE
jgi:hypothetical protein